MTREDILKGVSEILANSLAVDKTAIKLPLRLIDDLGLDSLDFLEVIFNMERKFGIKIRDEELDRLMRGEFLEEGAVRDGTLTPSQKENLSAFMPALAAQEGPVQATAVFSYITVESLVLLVERRLAR